MINGFFRIAFTGAAGSGFGMLAFYKGVIAGADVAGAFYDGCYTEIPTTHALDFKITMNAPAGVIPVQTGIPIATPLFMPISGSLSPDEVESGIPILLQTPLGPVNVLLKKIRDFP